MSLFIVSIEERVIMARVQYQNVVIPTFARVKKMGSTLLWIKQSLIDKYVGKLQQ